jgi:thymidylate synthase (FAD)
VKLIPIKLYDDNIGFIEYLDHMGSDLKVVNSARVSFGQQKTVLDESDEKLIRYLLKNHHTSTLEHNVVTFRFKVPLFVARQHMRHRTWSYNEISRRYTSDNLEFYEPAAFRQQSSLNRQASINENVKKSKILARRIADHHQQCRMLYENLIKWGVCREQARGVLPLNLYTEYYGTANLNNLLKFLDLRLHEGAQWEIRQVAKAILEILRELFPIIMLS